MTEEPTSWPTDLTVSGNRRTLTVTYDDDVSFALPAELLRVSSPSAEVQGHSPDQRVTVPGKRNVEIIDLVSIGSYAVRIAFDDMHNTGIFSWTYLRELGENKDDRFEAYLAELQEKGLSREPIMPGR